MNDPHRISWRGSAAQLAEQVDVTCPAIRAQPQEACAANGASAIQKASAAASCIWPSPTARPQIPALVTSGNRKKPQV